MLKFHSDVFKCYPRRLNHVFGPYTYRSFDGGNMLQKLMNRYKHWVATRKAKKESEADPEWMK